MGRQGEIGGDLQARFLMAVLDGSVHAPEDEGLYGHLASDYGCSSEYARQIINELESRDLVLVERVGRRPVGYDIHPRIVRRSSERWTPTEMLQALVETADSKRALTCDRYDRFGGDRPPSSVVIATFHSWEAAIAAAGLKPCT